VIDVNDITEKSIQDLVDNKVLEKKTLEYKQQLVIDKDAEKKNSLPTFLHSLTKMEELFYFEYLKMQQLVSQKQ